MASATRPAWDCGSLEAGDRVVSRAECGTNPSGRPSHATDSYYGSKGFMQYGFRSCKPVIVGPEWTHYNTATVDANYEGCHEGNSWYVFKDLGVPKAATITSAYLKLTPTVCDTPTAQANSEWRLKIYGVAEDDAFPGRVICPSQGYDWWAHNRFYFKGYLPGEPSAGWPQASGARLRAGSVEFDREHTSAKVNWRWTPATIPGSLETEWTSPDIKTIIQEIVNRSGWSPNNKLELVLAIDDMFVNAVDPDGFDTGWFDSPPTPVQYWIKWWGCTPFVTAAKRPHLVVNW